MQRENHVGATMSLLQAFHHRCLELLMAVDDDDFPISYLFYIVAVIIAMAFVIVGGFFFWFR